MITTLITILTILVLWLFGLPSYILRLAFQLLCELCGMIITLIFSIFGGFNIPSISNYLDTLKDFWDLVFQFIGYFRSIFLIDSISMNIIVYCLILKLVYKPGIAIYKMMVSWFGKVKIK